MNDCSTVSPFALNADFFDQRLFRLVLANRSCYLRLEHGGGVSASDSSIGSWRLAPQILVLHGSDASPAAEFSELEFDNGLARFRGRGLQGAGSLIELASRALPILSQDASASSTGLAAAKQAAVLIRTGDGDSDFQNPFEELCARYASCDFYRLVDKVGASQAAAMPPLPGLSVESCRALGLTQVTKPEQLLSQCWDFGFYAGLRELDEYERFVMIDLSSQEGGADSLDRIAAVLASDDQNDSVPDLIGFELRHRPDTRPREAGVGFLPVDYCYRLSPGCVCLSRRAASYLFTQRLLEAVKLRVSELSGLAAMHADVFVPSFLMAGGFECRDLDARRVGRVDRLRV